MTTLFVTQLLLALGALLSIPYIIKDIAEKKREIDEWWTEVIEEYNKDK